MRLNIVPEDTPLIISHKDIDAMGLNYQSLYMVVERPEDEYTEAVEMRRNLPHLIFSPYGYFTMDQLRQMYRNFGHPTIEKQMRIIEDAYIGDLPAGTRSMLTKLVKHSRICQLYQGRPGRFLFSINDPLVGEFNHIVQKDIVKLCDGNVLHILDFETKFQMGRFVSKMDAATAWKIHRRCWMDVFAGAPDIIHTDARSNFNSAEFKARADRMEIVMKIASTEAHDRVGIVERNHTQLRTIYNKICMDCPKMAKEDVMSMTFRAINDTPNSEVGICPTTMVFGIVPKIPGAGHRGTVAERANIIRECTAILLRMPARKTMRDSTQASNSASTAECETVRRLPTGSTVPVFCEKVGWQPYTMVRVVENDVDVILLSGKISTLA